MKFKAKTAHNPDGYGLFLTQKLAKKMIFRTILPCLVVANATYFFEICKNNVDFFFDLWYNVF